MHVAPLVSGALLRAPQPRLDATFIASPATAATTIAATLTTSPIKCSALYALCDLLIPINVGLAPVFGALFNFHTALAIVVAGGVAAATAAFYIGRHMQPRVLAWVDQTPLVSKQFAYVDRVITAGGFRAVLLLRLIPTPVPALNFLYGVTSVAAPSYILATLAGNLPGSAVVVSGAVLTRRLLLARSALAQQAWWTFALGAAGVAALCLAARVGVAAAKGALNELAAEDCVSAATVEATLRGVGEVGLTAAEELALAEGCAVEVIQEGCSPWLSREDAERSCS